jgi:hypothetical protein
MNYLGNAFSLQMLEGTPAAIRVEEVETFPADAVSIVGHADTARVLGVACRRVNLTLTAGDVLYVAQFMGGRLPEGATTLPEGVTLKIMRVEVVYAQEEKK